MAVFENFEYSVTDDGVSIDKYNGNEGFVSIPEKINGLKVKKIGNEAFRWHKEIREVTFPESLEYAGDYAFCECRGLKSVYFGNNLKYAGEHIFYNCRNLAEISIPSGLEYIGDGFAKNCENLKNITISSDNNLSSSVSGFLNELSGEIVIKIGETGGELILPSFGYEYIDKCYSKTFETVTHGAGVLYRKCIEKHRINYDLYDLAFRYAVREELPQTMCRIAINRLQSQNGLNNESKKQYIDYLSEHISDTIRTIVYYENIDFIEVMEKEHMLTEEILLSAINITSETDRADFTAEFMDRKMRLFGRKKKVFDL